jgi:hypothetical protein
MRVIMEAKIKLIRWTRLILPLLLLVFAGEARSQGSQELDLRLIRTFGYGGINQIEGNFNLRLSDPPPLARVDFLFNEEVVHTVTEAPYEYRFHTGSYPPGVYTMSARGVTSGGETLTSNAITTEFISSEEAQQAVIGFVVPLLVLVFGLLLAATVITAAISRRRGFTPGQYGQAGGAICPRCGKPYSRHFLSPNLLMGKFERCPHCGKWAIVGRASTEELRRAEAALREGSLESEASAESEEERLRRMLEESKYEE